MKDYGYDYHSKCPMCGSVCAIKLTNSQECGLFEYRHKGVPIQEALPDLNRVEREFIKSGYCPECQEQIFGDGKTDIIKKYK